MLIGVTRVLGTGVNQVLGVNQEYSPLYLLLFASQDWQQSLFKFIGLFGAMAAVAVYWYESCSTKPTLSIACSSFVVLAPAIT